MRGHIIGAIAGVAFAGVLSMAAQSAQMSFEHVMNIGSMGTGEGQFRYVEDFDLTIDGRHIMVTGLMWRATASKRFKR